MGKSSKTFESLVEAESPNQFCFLFLKKLVVYLFIKEDICKIRNWNSLWIADSYPG